MTGYLQRLQSKVHKDEPLTADEGNSLINYIVLLETFLRAACPYIASRGDDVQNKVNELINEGPREPRSPG